MIKKMLYGAVIPLFFSCAVLAQLTPKQEAARERGIALFKQSSWYSSQPLLQIAAAAGDREAQYYLGEAIRLSKRYTTVEAKKWYEAAAEQGDLYAMLRLSNKNDLCSEMGTCTGKSGEEWREHALKLAHERAAQGDTEAMTVLYTARQGLGWLERAAEAGDIYAQQLLASAYKSGSGWFLIPGSREKAIEKWFRASAEGGSPRGMFLYANFLYEHNAQREDVGYWLKKTAEAGHIDAIGGYALNIAHLPDSYGFPLNLVEAYGLTLMLSKLDGGGSAPEESRGNLPIIADKMTEQEIKQGKAFAKEWEKTHPPLSYYDPIYGY